MADTSIILQDPVFRPLVQENVLERAFHDALFPRMMFRLAATPVKFPGNVGDSMYLSAPGLMEPTMEPTNVDPSPADLTYEQWPVTMQQYANSMDSNMPTTAVALANLFLRNVHQLGLQAAQSLNRIVRDRGYNAALAGWTTCSTAAAGAYGGAGDTKVKVRSVNGLQTARRPDLPAGSPVRFEAVSASNPLGVTIVLDDGSLHATSITACSADIAGDTAGPGEITFADAIPGGRFVAADGAIYTADRTDIVRAGGGVKTSAVNGQLLTAAHIRSAVAKLRTNNVPEFGDGRYHAFIDPTSEVQALGDVEFRQLLTSLPDYYMFKSAALGECLGTVFLRDSECPQPTTVKRTAAGAYTKADPFAGQLYHNNTPATGNPVHRVLFMGAAAIFEYYLELDQLISEVGVGGKVGDLRVTNNGLEVFTDRIQLIFRWPQDRLQNNLSTSWKFIGDWPVRTDSAVGGPARYKRLATIEHGE